MSVQCTCQMTIPCGVHTPKEYVIVPNYQYPHPKGYEPLVLKSQLIAQLREKVEGLEHTPWSRFHAGIPTTTDTVEVSEVLSLLTEIEGEMK